MTRRKPTEPVAILRAIVRELERAPWNPSRCTVPMAQRARQNAPGHAHLHAGLWDRENGAIGGKACAWCALWAEARRIVKVRP